MMPILNVTTALIKGNQWPALQCCPWIGEHEGASWAGPVLLGQLIVVSGLDVKPVLLQPSLIACLSLIAAKQQ